MLLYGILKVNLNQGLKTILIPYFPTLDLISDLRYLSLRIDLSKSSFRTIRTNSVCFRETRKLRENQLERGAGRKSPYIYMTDDVTKWVRDIRNSLRIRHKEFKAGGISTWIPLVVPPVLCLIDNEEKVKLNWLSCSPCQENHGYYFKADWRVEIYVKPCFMHPKSLSFWSEMMKKKPSQVTGLKNNTRLRRPGKGF